MFSQQFCHKEPLWPLSLVLLLPHADSDQATNLDYSLATFTS